MDEEQNYLSCECGNKTFIAETEDTENRVEKRIEVLICTFCEKRTYLEPVHRTRVLQ